jgi:PAS domain S-box-containing protein
MKNIADDIQGYLASIIASSDDAIISTNLDGIIRTWNKAAERMFGYTCEEAVGKHISLIIPAEKKDEEFIILGRVKAGQQTDHFETLRRRKNGELIDVSLTVSPIKNAESHIIGASKIARDIRDVKKSERLSAHLAAIVSSSDDAIISKNLDGIIQTWNASAERIFGYKAEEAIGQHISLLIPPDKLDEEYAIIGKIRAGERVVHFQTIRHTKTGEAVNVSLTVSPIHDRGGKVIGASKVARDITEQKRTETALREANQRKDEFIANISHELRTPMNAVIGLSHLLSMSETLTPREKKFVVTLRQSADNLMGLINNLLDFSKFQTGMFETEEVEFDLTEILQKVINIQQVRADQKELAIALSYDSPLNKHYIGDAFRLQQIVSNLVDNAVKFTDAGEITISVRGEQNPADDRTVLTLEVADTGIGIPEEKCNAIFDKFIQADTSITRKYGGSGLGLALCKAFAEEMGGTIAVRSRTGLGTTFIVTLPLKNSTQIAPIAQNEPEDQRHKNILLVDDYEPNLLVTTALLDLLGYSYDTAYNGIEALRQFQKCRYDAVLMDVQMHGMDGFESTRRIRAWEREKDMPRTPVVAMTAHVLEKDKRQCLEAGMDDFIPKPFNHMMLQDKLADLIGMAAA